MVGTNCLSDGTQGQASCRVCQGNNRQAELLPEMLERLRAEHIASHFGDVTFTDASSPNACSRQQLSATTLEAEKPGIACSGYRPSRHWSLCRVNGDKS